MDTCTITAARPRPSACHVRIVEPGQFEIRNDLLTGNRRVVIGDRPELGAVALTHPALDAYPADVRARLAS